MNTFLGFVFLLGAIIASVQGFLHTSTVFIILSCHAFIMARIDRLDEKLEDILLDD